MANDTLKKIKSKILTPHRIIVAGFISVILIGAFLLSLPISSKSGVWMNFVDSIFTSTSAVCVTGLVVVDTATYFTIFGQIVILILIQIGGLGFMTVTTIVFIVLGRKFTLRDRLLMQEAISNLDLKDITKIVRNIVITAFIIEGIGAVFLFFGFLPQMGVPQSLYFGVFHSISAFCNAGFDVLGGATIPFSSLSSFSSAVLVILPIGALIVSGGLGFNVISDMFHAKKWKRMTMYTRIVLAVTGTLILLGTVFFLILEYSNPYTIGDMNFGDKLMNSLFQSISPRTAGYSSFDQNALTQPSKIMTMVLMFIGASPASTGGGIKTTTLFVIFLVAIAKLKDSDEIVAFKRSISAKNGFKAFSVFLFALTTITTLVFLCSISQTLEGNNISLEALTFEAISAFSTVGLSTGITTQLTYFSRLMFSLVMLIGRIGPFTMGVAILGKTGTKKINLKYPEAKIIIT